LSHYYFWKSHRADVIEQENMIGPRLAKQLDLLQFLRLREARVLRSFDNHQIRMLLGRRYAGPNGEFLCPDEEVIPRALGFLDTMCAVGILERFDLSVRQICRRLNLAPPKRMPHRNSHRKFDTHPRLEPVEREELTPEIEAELDRLTRFDRQLYEHVRDVVLRMGGRAATSRSGLQRTFNQVLCFGPIATTAAAACRRLMNRKVS
jgi:hypothetical protein